MAIYIFDCSVLDIVSLTLRVLYCRAFLICWRDIYSYDFAFLSVPRRRSRHDCHVSRLICRREMSGRSASLLFTFGLHRIIILSFSLLQAAVSIDYFILLAGYGIRRLPFSLHFIEQRIAAAQTPATMPLATVVWWLLSPSEVTLRWLSDAAAVPRRQAACRASPPFSLRIFRRSGFILLRWLLLLLIGYWYCTDTRDWLASCFMSFFCSTFRPHMMGPMTVDIASRFTAPLASARHERRCVCAASTFRHCARAAFADSRHFRWEIILATADMLDGAYSPVCLSRFLSHGHIAPYIYISFYIRHAAQFIFICIISPMPPASQPHLRPLPKVSGHHFS